jgi:hypothetical protein
VTEQPEDFPGVEGHLDPEERDIETPTEDAVEQAFPTDLAEAEAGTEVHRGLEVSEYDAVEQARVVEIEDEYR